MPLVVGVAPVVNALLNGPMVAVSFVAFDAPNTEDDEILTALSRCDRFGCQPDALDCVLRFDVLADVFELLQIGGGFEWSKSKYSRTPAWRPVAPAAAVGVAAEIDNGAGTEADVGVGGGATDVEFVFDDAELL